ncbi:hypothetical protein AAVH_19702, partial [Aphelenchoides avenae]
PARIRDLRVTSNCVGHLRFDVRNLDIGVPPTRRQPDDDFMFGSDLYAVRYDIADHGNGTRLSIHFKSEDGEEREVAIRHGKTEHEEFFEPTEEEEEFDEHWHASEPTDCYGGRW